MLRTCFLLVTIWVSINAVCAGQTLRVGVFDVDASPPVGSPLAYDPCDGVEGRLSCRGVVLLGDRQPIVLCAVDWIGIGNASQVVFRGAIAEAVETSVDRVTVHTLHQHDAPHWDLSAEQLLAEHGLADQFYDSTFARRVVQKAAEAAAAARESAREVTHLGLGEGKVRMVASNRRILGPDGKVKYVRYTATKDPVIRAQPVGTIDPQVKIISLWQNQTPLVAISYYATHPQSYYRTGLANPDFPGIARNMRQQATGAPHLHFNGAGGNIGAGKWNDGSTENRQILAKRVAAGMALAWEATQKQAVTAADLGWKTQPVLLPPAPHLDEQQLMGILHDKQAQATARNAAARNLVWLKRCQSKDPITLSCLRLGSARVLHMPGELFVEYQLAAQKMKPQALVAMAAYGDYAPGYIGTQVAYGEGGYETSQRASRVAPGVEGVLMPAIRSLLQDR